MLKQIQRTTQYIQFTIYTIYTVHNTYSSQYIYNSTQYIQFRNNFFTGIYISNQIYDKSILILVFFYISSILVYVRVTTLHRENKSLGPSPTSRVEVNTEGNFFSHITSSEFKRGPLVLRCIKCL